MKYTINKNTLTLTRKPRKCKDGLKIYFTRSVDERKTTDYPIATTNLNRKEYNIEEISSFFYIIRVEILQPTFIFWRKKWQVVEPVDNFLSK